MLWTVHVYGRENTIQQLFSFYHLMTAVTWNIFKYSMFFLPFLKPILTTQNGFCGHWDWRKHLHGVRAGFEFYWITKFWRLCGICHAYALSCRDPGVQLTRLQRKERVRKGHLIGWTCTDFEGMQGSVGRVLSLKGDTVQGLPLLEALIHSLLHHYGQVCSMQQAHPPIVCLE